MEGPFRSLTLGCAITFVFACGTRSGSPESIQYHGHSSNGGSAAASAGSGGGGRGGTAGEATSPGGSAGSPGGSSSGGAAGSAGSAGSGGDGGDGGIGGNPDYPPYGSSGPLTGPPGPRFIGRFSPDSEFAWSGSAVELRFNGSDVSVTLDDWGHDYFEVIVDGVHHVLAVDAGTQTYQLASNLAAGDHEVVLYRRTEGFFGPTKFLGFSVAQSAWLPSHAPAERRVEIVADSTAVGYGVEGKDETCGFDAKTENSYIAYPEVTARTLGAEVRTLGWSGIGVYRDNSGNTSVANRMETRYVRALPTEDDSTWNFSQWIPQAVVVNLGSNDFVTNDPTSAFETAYYSLLANIRSHYPQARIYCAVGSSLFDSEYPRLKPRIQAIVATRQAAGDNVAFLDFGTTNYDDTYGCDWHPSVATHELMASILAARLKQDFGW